VVLHDFFSKVGVLGADSASRLVADVYIVRQGSSEKDAKRDNLQVAIRGRSPLAAAP
jgi:hypothetical protein